MSKVLVVGDRGVQGRRYSAILKYLSVPFKGIDLGDSWRTQLPIDEYSHVILTTPTDTHLEMILRIRSYLPEQPILCEKPLHKNSKDLEGFDGSNIYVVNQYRYLLTEQNLTGLEHSYYAYFNAGKDGLGWDHFQIIGLANSTVDCWYDTPLWQCSINGARLNIALMDLAYIDMVMDFLGDRKYSWDFEKAKEVTKKVEKFLETHNG